MVSSEQVPAAGGIPDDHRPCVARRHRKDRRVVGVRHRGIDDLGVHERTQQAGHVGPDAQRIQIRQDVARTGGAAAQVGEPDELRLEFLHFAHECVVQLLREFYLIVYANVVESQRGNRRR